MTCNLATTEFENRVTSFSARYTLNGPFSANISLIDFTREDDPGCQLVCAPVHVSLDSSMEYTGDPTDITADTTSCYGVDPLWINGLAETYSDTDRVTSVGIGSYFRYLESKKVITQTFNGFPVSTVLDTVLKYYSGIPTTLFNLVSDIDNPVKGPVTGNNLYDEISQLAQAAYSDLYVQVGGELEISRWKDHTSPVDFAIPDTHIISAVKSEYRKPNTAIIEATGAQISAIDCGDQTLTSDSAGNKGTTRSCVVSGIPSQSADVGYNNLSGSKEDILSGKLDNTAGLTATGGKKDVSEGSFTQEFETDSTPIDKDGKIIQSIVNGRIRSKTQEGIYGYTHGRNYGGGYGGSQTFFNAVPQLLARKFPVPYSAFGLGAFGSKLFSNLFNGDGGSSDQNLSTQQSKTTLVLPEVSDCGISTETISNKYLYKKENLFALDVRRYQEILLSQNVWNVEVGYLPCLKINDVVTFEVPAIVTPNGTTAAIPVQGIVAGIDLQVQRTDSAHVPEMRLSIMDTKCLGNTEVESGNLIQTICAGEGSNDFNPWQVSQLGLEQQAQQTSNQVILFASGAASAFAYYEHTCATDDEYTISFDYEALQGVGGVNFNIIGGNPNTILNNSGFYTADFTPTGTSFTLRWILNNPAVSTYMIITNLRLTKKVTI